MMTQVAMKPLNPPIPDVGPEFFDLLKCNPWRPVDAWWTRATGTNDSTQPRATSIRDTERGSKWIWKALRFQRAMTAAKGFYQHLDVAVDYSDVFWAHRLHQAPELRVLRAGVEARILARQTNEQIHAKVGGWPEAIEAYEALFFNVRDRLRLHDFIFNCVLGQAAQRGLQARDYELLWKIAGYTAGPRVLDALIGHFPNPMWANREEDVPAFFQDSAINLMKKKASVAALTVPVEGHTQLHLLEAFVKFVEVERTTDSAGGANDQIQEGLQQMLTSLPYHTLSIDTIKRVPAYDSGAVELSTEELLLSSVGYKIPGIDSLQNLKFPEPDAKP